MYKCTPKDWISTLSTYRFEGFAISHLKFLISHQCVVNHNRASPSDLLDPRMASCCPKDVEMRCTRAEEAEAGGRSSLEGTTWDSKTRNSQEFQKTPQLQNDKMTKCQVSFLLSRTCFKNLPKVSIGNSLFNWGLKPCCFGWSKSQQSIQQSIWGECLQICEFIPPKKNLNSSHFLGEVSITTPKKKTHPFSVGFLHPAFHPDTPNTHLLSHRILQRPWHARSRWPPWPKAAKNPTWMLQDS